MLQKRFQRKSRSQEKKINLANGGASGIPEAERQSKEKRSSLSSRHSSLARKKYQKTETRGNMTNGEKNHFTGVTRSENNCLESEKMEVQSIVDQKSRSAIKAHKSAQPFGKKHALKSLSNGVRVLRARSNKSLNIVSKSENHSTEISAQNSKGRRRKHKNKKHVPQDELSRIRKRVRYFLNRIGFEQSMIDAYSSEGWKGQSQEKIRPEKELQKAASKIVQCKLAIREAFRELHSLSLEGSLEKSAFDNEGQVNSEDIFCAKCGSKDLLLDNDIILCDGACDRGFHQKCLEPPLATEDIPPGDEGWLCPACDCKLDCVDLVNDYLDTAFELEESWESFFSEAVEATADGNEKLLELEDMPSDDTEDDDYDPDGPELPDGTQDEDSSSSEESGSSSNSSSDDEGSESHEGSESNEDSKVSEDDSEYSSEHLVDPKKKKTKMARDKKSLESPDLPVISDADENDNDALPVSGKRHRQEVDYKKLHDEMYGADDDKSMSEDDEEWGAGKQKGRQYGMESDDSSASEGKQLKKVSVTRKKVKVSDLKSPDDINQSKSTSYKKEKFENENGECTLEKKAVNHEGNTHADVLPLELESAAKQNAGQQEQCGRSSVSSKKRAFSRLPTSAIEKLRRVFGENRFPSRSVKEDLANELDISFKQVNKWFDNARNSLKSPAEKKQANIPVEQDSGNIFSHSLSGTKQADTTIDQDNDKLTPGDKLQNPSSVEKGRKNMKSSSEKRKKMGRGYHENKEVKGATDTGNKTLQQKRRHTLAV
uniref:Uncharacterized protein n=1 Tax=Araucaria cunninghamii TaxID=56994 RepID=A0A0D6R2W9_ARACU